MADFLSGLRLAVLGGVLAVIAVLGSMAFYYREESEKLRERIEALSAKNQNLTYQIEELAKECDTTIRALQKSCSERLEVEREQAKKQLRTCQKLFERRKKLEEKLRNIDRL